MCFLLLQGVVRQVGYIQRRRGEVHLFFGYPSTTAGLVIGLEVFYFQWSPSPSLPTTSEALFCQCRINKINIIEVNEYYNFEYAIILYLFFQAGNPNDYLHVLIYQFTLL